MLKYIVYKGADGFRWHSECGGNITSHNAQGLSNKAHAIRQAIKHAAGRQVYWWNGDTKTKRGKTVKVLVRLA